MWSQAHEGELPSRFEWNTGPAPKAAYRYHVALTVDDRVYSLGGDNDGAFEVFNPEAGAWNALQDMPTARVFLGGAVLDQHIYSVGGMDGEGNYLSIVESYDLPEDRWRRCTPLEVARSRLAVVALDGALYAIGGLAGRSDADYHNSPVVERYDPGTDQWTRVADLPTARHGHSAVVIDNKIMVAGGYTEDGATDIVEVYDPGIDHWEQAPSLPVARGFFGMVVIRQKVYAIGGRVRTDRGPIEQYDPRRDRWESLDPLPAWRNRFGLTALGKKVFLIGGEDHSDSVLIGQLVEEN